MHTVIYGTDIQFWPTLAVNDDHWVFEKWWAASDDHWVFEKWWAASDEQRVMTIECLRSDEQRVIGSEWWPLSVWGVMSSELSAVSDDHWVFEEWWAASYRQRVTIIECWGVVSSKGWGMTLVLHSLPPALFLLLSSFLFFPVSYM